MMKMRTLKNISNKAPFLPKHLLTAFVKYFPSCRLPEIMLRLLKSRSKSKNDIYSMSKHIPKGTTYFPSSDTMIRSVSSC